MPLLSSVLGLWIRHNKADPDFRNTARAFLPRDAMQAQPVSSCGVRPSVRPSRCWILSKRINISSKLFHLRVATPI